MSALVFTPRDAEKFWARVDKSAGPDACWPWVGGAVSGGYGCFYAGRSYHRAHRVAYVLSNGPIRDGLLVCHRCDSPPCVNPAHLFLGTPSDNSRDAASKGRLKLQRDPESAATRVLTRDQVALLRTELRDVSTYELADRWGISPAALQAAKRGQSWSHLDVPPAPRSRFITWRGETRKLREWARVLGVHHYALSRLLERYPTEEAMAIAQEKRDKPANAWHAAQGKGEE